MKTEKLFSINFMSITVKDLTKYLVKCIRENDHIHLHTVNVDHLVIGIKQKRFNQVMKNANIVVADGMPIVWYSRIIHRPLPERVAGIDLCEYMCKKSAELNFKIFLLGAKQGVGLKAKEKMCEKYPGLQIVGVYSPGADEISDEYESKKIIERINNSNANVLFVAFGAPKQEYWISHYKTLLKTNVNIGVGATIDFMAGKVKRAPRIMQKLGLEWLFRISTDPKRLVKRYIINDFLFIKILILDFYKQRMHQRMN